MINIIALAWFITHFEPLQFMIDKIAAFIVLKSNRSVRMIVDLFHTALGCMKCMGFWIALISTGNFFYACIVSLISYFIQLCLQKLS